MVSVKCWGGVKDCLRKDLYIRQVEIYVMVKLILEKYEVFVSVFKI